MVRRADDEPYPERRTDFRYAADARVEYRIIDSGKTGVGKLVDISTGGVLFLPHDPLAAGVEIELTIGWPARRNYPPVIDLWIVGEVVRTEASHTAVKILRYDFRPHSVRKSA